MRPRWDSNSSSRAWQQAESPPAYWDRKLAIARATPVAGLMIGSDLASLAPVFLTPEILRTHMHVLGSTGVGKSYFLEAAIKSLILQGHGVALLDPHGDLYHRILRFCAWLAARKPELQLHQRVIPFDVAERRQIIGFNPIARNARVMTYQVVALMEAIRKCWGQGSFQETPRLARWLFNVAYALISADVTFIQAQHLVSPGASAVRAAICARIENTRIRDEWSWLESIKIDKREERIESTLNRVKPFVEHEIIRPILGQYTQTIDFGNVVNGRKILLINLARQNSISEDDQHLLGTLIINELLTAAFARPAGARTPFFAFIDEFSHFVTKDACEVLDGGRKFGLHLTLAHQHLQQLKAQDPEVYYSTLTNARTKIVFGGLNDEDVDLVAKELFTGEFDPDLVKDEIWHRGFAPVESSRIVRADSRSQSEGDSYGRVSHTSLASSRSWIPGSNYWTSLTPSQIGQTSGRTRGVSESHQSSRSSSVTETTVPFYEFHEYSELTSRTFRSLEEQLYTKKAQLKRQPNQHAAVLLPDQRVQLIKVATLRELPVSEDQCDEFRFRCFEAAGCYKSLESATAEVASLEEKLLLEASPPIIVNSEAHDEQESPRGKAPIPIWTRTTVASGTESKTRSKNGKKAGA